MQDFTILTSCYNNKIYLKDWMNSIIIQNHRPLSVVFVDDYSNDGSFDYVNDNKKIFYEHDIKIILHKNKQRLYCGSSYAKALSLSKSYYLGILDADDLLIKNAVKDICLVYKEYPLGHIYTQFCFVKDNLDFLKFGFSRHPGKGNSLLDAGLSKVHAYSHWRTCTRKSPDVYKIFKEGMTSCVDKHMGYVLEEIYDGGFYNKTLYKYRVRKHSISKTEPSMIAWRELVNFFKTRRKKQNIKVYPVNVIPVHE
jgi:glycosyltransferase involved in cell wall biosynthesis